MQSMMNTQLKARYCIYLIRSANSAIDIISRVLLIIGGKRQTLAERAIMAELAACNYWSARVISALSQLVIEKKYPLDPNEGKQIRQINKDLVGKLEAFCQAADHSLNYLEQYFEHDLWLILNEDQTSMRLSQIVGNLERMATPITKD